MENHERVIFAQKKIQIAACLYSKQIIINRMKQKQIQWHVETTYSKEIIGLTLTLAIKVKVQIYTFALRERKELFFASSLQFETLK